MNRDKGDVVRGGVLIFKVLDSLLTRRERVCSFSIFFFFFRFFFSSLLLFTTSRQAKRNFQQPVAYRVEVSGYFKN